MKFSQRLGITPIDTKLQINAISDDLRNSIWNVLHTNLFKTRDFLSGSRGYSPDIDRFTESLWADLFKKPVDTRPEHSHQKMEALREYFFHAEWHQVYDFLEFLLRYYKSQRLTDFVNGILDRELAGYRYVHSALVPVTDEIEVQELKSALSADSPTGSRAHLAQALHLLSRREKPDYRNSIKESISAVESCAQELTGNPKATLGDALAFLEKKGMIHGALKRGFSALYGYASDEGGIRHAMLEEPNLGIAEAKYFAVACASFVNYLKMRE